MKRPSISVFFPCYNDAKTIVQLVLKANKILKKVASKYEIIVVNDGSQDNSLEILNRIKKSVKNLRIVNHKKNRGYGGALASGFAAARYSLVFYTDGDGQYDVSEIPLLLDCLTSDIDVVNGIKLDRQDTTARIIIGNAYKSVVRNIFDIPIYDVDCDFRLIRRKFLKNLRIKYHSGAVCVELIKRLQINRSRFREVSVHHYSRRFGTSQFFKFWPLFNTAIDLIRLFAELNGIDKAWSRIVSKISNLSFATRARNYFLGGQRLITTGHTVKTAYEQAQYYSQSDNYFEKLSRHSEKTFEWWISYLKRFVKNKRGVKIMEIGCGNGLSSFLIAKTFSLTQVTGTDISSRFIAYARRHYRRPNLFFKAMSALNFDISDNSFDVICLFDVIEHLPDVEKFLSEVKRTLKIGGVLLISSPNAINLWVPYRDLIKRRSRLPYTTHSWQNIFIIARNSYFIIKKSLSLTANFLYVRPDYRESVANLSDTDMVYLANPIDLSKKLRALGFEIISRSSLEDQNPSLRILEPILYGFYSVKIAAKKLKN